MRNVAHKRSGYWGQQSVLSTYCHGRCLRSIPALHPRQCSKAVHTELQQAGCHPLLLQAKLSSLTWSISHLVWCLLPVTDLEWSGTWPKTTMSHAPRRLSLRNLHISAVAWTVITLKSIIICCFYTGNYIGAPTRVTPHRLKMETKSLLLHIDFMM